MDTYSVVLKAFDLLLKYGRNTTAFAARDIGSNLVASATQATCMLGMHETGLLSKQQESQFVQELLALQILDPGPYQFSWCREERPSLWASARAIRAIAVCQPELVSEERVQKGIDWIIRQMSPTNSGFGYRAGNVSRPVYSYHAIKALTECCPGSNEERKTVILSALRRTSSYLRDSQIEPGIWGNGEGRNTCPASTLFAICALLDYEGVSGETIVSQPMRSAAISLIRSQLSVSPESWPVFREFAENWTLDFFFPGKVNLLLQIASPEDPLVGQLVHYLVRNYVPYREALGWSLGPNQQIWTWTTALGLLSIASYSATVRRNYTSQYSMPSEQARLQTRVNLLQKQRTVLLAILILATLAWLGSLFPQTVLQLLTNEWTVRIGIPIVVIVVEELFWGWLRRRLRRVRKRLSLG